MKTITLSSLQPLIDFRGTAMTLYMPTHTSPAPENMREDQIRFKNLIRSAREALEKEHIDGTSATQITSQLEALQDDQDFWRQARSGLVVFVSPKKLSAFALPFECQDYVAVGETFDLSIAFAACSYAQDFYVLALAVHNPKVFKGTIDGLQELAGLNLPTSPEAALNIDEMFVNSNTVRGVATSGGGNGRISSHGQGDSREAGNEERLMFFRMIDKILTDETKLDQRMPLLLAGIDSEVAEYRDISKYPKLMGSHLSGNFTSVPVHDLHQAAWKVVDKELGLDSREQAVSTFYELAGSGKSTSDVEELKAAAEAGRVDTLMIGSVVETRDSVTDTSGSILKLHIPKGIQPAALREIVRSVVAQGGRVIAMVDEMMPAKAPLSATFRY